MWKLSYSRYYSGLHMTRYRNNDNNKYSLGELLWFIINRYYGVVDLSAITFLVNKGWCCREVNNNFYFVHKLMWIYWRRAWYIGVIFTFWIYNMQNDNTFVRLHVAGHLSTDFYFFDEETPLKMFHWHYNLILLDRVLIFLYPKLILILIFSW